MIDLRQNIIKWLSENIAKSFTDENICEKKKKKKPRDQILCKASFTICLDEFANEI